MACSIEKNETYTREDQLYARNGMQEAKSIPSDDDLFGDGQIGPRCLLYPVSREKGVKGRGDGGGRG